MDSIPITILVDNDPLTARWALVNYAYYRDAESLVTTIPNFSFREPGVTHQFRVTIDGEGVFTRDGSTVKHNPFQICLYPEEILGNSCQPETTPAVSFQDLAADRKSFTVTFTTPEDTRWGRWVYRLFINDEPDDALPLAFTYTSPTERQRIDQGIGARGSNAPPEATGETASKETSDDSTADTQAEPDVLSSLARVNKGLVEFPTIFGSSLLPSDVSLQPLFWIKETQRDLHLEFKLDTPGYTFVQGVPELNPCNRGSTTKPPLQVEWYGVSDPKNCPNDEPYPRGFSNSHTARSTTGQQSQGVNLSEVRWNEPEPNGEGRISTFYFALRGPQTDVDEANLESKRTILLVDPMIINDLPQDPPP